MANSIKKKNNSSSVKKIKVNNTNNVEKVITKNKSTVLTGNKSNAVRKKPVVRKVVQDEKGNVTTILNTEINKDVKAKKVNKSKNAKINEIKNLEKLEEKKNEIKIDNQDANVNIVLTDLEKSVDNTKNETNEQHVINNEEETIIDENKLETFVESQKQKSNKKKILIPGNRKQAINISKGKKSKKNLSSEKNVKSIIKDEPVIKEEEQVIEVKKPDEVKVKAIRVPRIENIKKKAVKAKKQTNKNAKNITTGKKVKSVYDPKLNRWVVKEDKSKDAYSKDKRKLTPSEENDYAYEIESGGIKSKFFEEVNVEKFKEAKKAKRKKYPKKILITLIVLIILGSGAYFFYQKYQDKIRRELNMYDVYNLGTEVKLNDDSVWYVVEKSDGSKPNVVLLSQGLIDVNEDGKIDDNDKKQYSSGNVAYDVLDSSSIAYYLENEYKTKLEEKVGEINSIKLFDSKYFVKIRDTFKYGYEWEGENILTSNAVNGYFVATTHDKIYYVSRSGAYRLSKPTDKHYIRYVIDIDKGSIKKEEPVQEKIEEEEKITGQE